MKRNAITRIILFSISIMVLLAIFAFSFDIGNLIFLNDSFDSVTEKEPVPLAESDDTVSTSVNADDILELEIEWAAGSISIVPDNYATSITVIEPKMTQDKYQMRCVQSGNKLQIQFHDPQYAKLFQDSLPSKDLTIVVPADWNCEDLQIDAASASIQVSDMNIQDVEINGASGICAFVSCIVDELEVNTASGDVSFNGTLKRMSFNAASANCYLTLNNIPFELDMESMSGDLKVVLPENAEFELEMDTLSGGFTSDFETTMQNGRHVCGSGQCRISINALSGDVSIFKDTTHHTHNESCYAENSTCPDKSHH